MDETWGLTPMTRVEVVIGGEDVPVLAELFSEAGAPAERAGALLDGLRPMLAHRSGVLFVSETWVSRPEYFQ